MKIIQIAVAAAYDDSVPDILFALTDTGRVFSKPAHTDEWKEVDAIPKHLLTKK